LLSIAGDADPVADGILPWPFMECVVSQQLSEASECHGNEPGMLVGALVA
jgi:hypothetical protein